ncbi:testis-specific Y-encoded protein 1-like, partial [Bos taurus]|uniref:testis-specific Y-encoded protein 1-like n=1 Tax=Bos taurus TaxID=9913 RepID=UPI0028CBAEB3
MSHPFTSDPVWGHGQGQEEHERWSEECRSILGPRTYFVVSPDPQVATAGDNATHVSVEAAGDGGALVDRDVAGIRRVFQLLVEDIMEEVEVLADEEQQRGSSQDLKEKVLEDQGKELPGDTNELLALDALQALSTLQVELSSDHEKNCRGYVSFMCKSHQRRKHDLAQRSA